MKHIITFAIMSLFVSGMALAEESKTKCPYMQESTERVNTKQDLNSVKPSQNKRPGAVAG